MNYEKDQAKLLQLLDEVVSDTEEIYDDVESEGEADIIQAHLSDSDTEQEGESDREDEAPPAKIPRVPSFIGKDGTIWKKHRPIQNVRTRQSNIVIQLPGVKPIAKNAKSVADCWKLLFSDEILEIIVSNTNKYIQKMKDKYTRERSAKMTDIVEIRALLGLLYLAGCLKSSRLNTQELWNRNGSGIELFWLTMSQQRFLFLLRHLRFDDTDSREERKKTDKMAPIRDLFVLFVANCKNAYTISEYGTIDEKLEAFRGRCGFKQYIPSKPNKYGLKVFALVDAKTRYTLNLELYLGQQPEGPYRVSNAPSSVVTRLIGPISGTGRNITCDNWFTSFELIQNLFTNHKLTYVGTVRKNKRQLPPEFINTKSRCINSSIFGYQENTTIVSYVPKKGKNVILASSLHHDDQIDESTGEQYKPEIITFYNSTKGGVDTVDELCATYDVSRNTRRWPMVLFYALMNVAGINSQIVHVANNQTSLIRRMYLKQLAVELIDEHLKRRTMMKNLNPTIRQRRQEVTGILPEVPRANPETPNVKKRCYLCKKDSKTRYFCKICKKFICLSHAEFLCPSCIPESEN